MNTCRMDKYSSYKNENVAIYTKKTSKEEDVNEPFVGKVSWMNLELEYFNVNIVEFVDSHVSGDYHQINRLIELVKQGEIKAILIWDFEEIPLEIVGRLVEECKRRNVYLNGFLTTIEIM